MSRRPPISTLFPTRRSSDLIDSVYDDLFKRYLENEDILPEGFAVPKDKYNPSNKPKILEAFKNYINSRETGIEVTDARTNEMISAAQVLFNHVPIPSNNKAKIGELLAGIRTDPAYLTTTFISDFYQFVTREKAKGSELYESVLSNFVFNNTDISIKINDQRFINAYSSLSEGFPFKQELQDYALLKKNDPINVLNNVTSETLLPQSNTERITAHNNKSIINDYLGSVSKDRGHVIARTNDSIIKVDGQLYEKVAKDVFAPIVSEESTTYFSIPRLDTNEKVISALEKTNQRMSSNDTMTLEEFEDSINNKALSPRQSEFLDTLSATPHPKVKGAFQIKEGDSTLSFKFDGKSVSLELLNTPESSRGKGQAKTLLKIGRAHV